MAIKNRDIPPIGSVVAVIWNDSGSQADREDIPVGEHTTMTMVRYGRLDFVNRLRIVVSYEHDHTIPDPDRDGNRSSLAIARKSIVRIIKLMDEAPKDGRVR